VQTQAPIKGAKVEISSSGLASSSKSDANGCFQVGPLRCLRFGFVVPPEPHVRPECSHVTGPNLLLRVSRAGFAEVELVVPTQSTNQSAELDVGDVYLRSK
jgi:hypothetical protein